MAGLPTEVIQSASVKASELEIAVARRALARRGTFDDVTAKIITDAATAALASITREHDLTTSRANALRALE